MKFFTTGFAGKTVAELVALLDKHSAVLADIRFAPVSRDLQWTKDYLSLMLKKRYRHVGALGNRNFDKPDSKIQIHNLDLGVRLIESWESNAVLMCVCKDYENCHRRVVAEELKKRGHSVEEIANW